MQYLCGGGGGGGGAQYHEGDVGVYYEYRGGLSGDIMSTMGCSVPWEYYEYHGDVQYS